MTDRDPRVLPPQTVDSSDGPTPASEGLPPRGVDLGDEDLTQWATFGDTPVTQALEEREQRRASEALGEILDQATSDQLREIIAAAHLRLAESDDTGDA